jgi:hypothetical protein
MAPFSLSKDSASVINRICDVHVYISQGILGYVVTMPLVNRGIFKALRLIPLPILTDKNKFVYIETENQILYVDETRQYYFTAIREKLSKCKSAEAGVYIYVNRPNLY